MLGLLFKDVLDVCISPCCLSLFNDRSVGMPKVLFLGVAVSGGFN